MRNPLVTITLMLCALFFQSFPVFASATSCHELAEELGKALLQATPAEPTEESERTIYRLAVNAAMEGFLRSARGTLSAVAAVHPHADGVKARLKPLHDRIATLSAKAQLRGDATWAQALADKAFRNQTVAAITRLSFGKQENWEEVMTRVLLEKMLAFGPDAWQKAITDGMETLHAEWDGGALPSVAKPIMPVLGHEPSLQILTAFTPFVHTPEHL